jgi:L-malate glycosyltransferase
VSRAPRILHLFANYKWTGPADPAIRTAARLRQQGFDVVFAQAGFVHPGGEHRMAEELWHWRVPVLAGLGLPKHLRVGPLLRDVRQLRALLQRDGFDLLHTHLPGDHLLAALAAHRVRPRPVLVRSFYDPEPPRGLRNRAALRATDGMIAPTRKVAEALAGRGIAAGRILFQEPVTEPRTLEGPTLRAEWAVPAGAFVVGITARIQPHRRFDLLWDVARRTVDANAEARFVLLGRGNAEDTEALVRAPLRRLGLVDHVVLPGYLREPGYSAALRSLDAFLFLVPGSDGTCRAVREAMAFGLPVVATGRGMLPELLQPRADGVPPGCTCPESSVDLAAALVQLMHDRALRRRMGGAALQRARLDMDPVAAARELSMFYQRLLSERAVGGES